MFLSPTRTVGSLVCVAALVLSSCTSGEEADPSAGPTTSDPGLQIAAPIDCAVNAYCAVGLADVYGVDIGQNIQPKGRIADSVAALKQGEVDLAVVFSASPYVTDPGLVVVEDDQQMIAADNVVTAYRRSLRELYGQALGDELDALAELITPEALAALDAELSIGVRPAIAARRWLDERAAAPGDVEDVPGPVLTIGTADFLESRALGQVLSGYLDDRGFSTKVRSLPGGRPQVVDALANGDIDLAPEYTAALLEYLNGNAGEAGQDSTANYRRLAQFTELIGVKLANMASAISNNVFVTTPEKADELDLRALSDLATMRLPEAATDPRPGISTERPELGVLVRAVDHQLASGSSGPEVRDLQLRLQELDFDVSVTGDFDADTIAAVREFQGQQGIAPTGVVRRSTEKALADPQPVDDPNPVKPGDPGATDPPGTSGGSKVIYLTFDDGPAVTYTLQILDLLDQYDAKATFFELGENATAHPELTKAVLKRGHALASHTWDHADMTTLSANALQSEIRHTSEALAKLAGKEMTCLRPPYGAVNDNVKAAIAGNDLTMWLWNIDPQDWNRPGVPAIVNNVVSNARPGAVSLMHDGGGDRSQSVAALRQILPRLAKQGYRFESLPGC